MKVQEISERKGGNKMGLILSERHLNAVNRKDLYAIESNKAEASRNLAIAKLREINLKNGKARR